MREIRTSGLTRGRGISSLPTLLRDIFLIKSQGANIPLKFLAAKNGKEVNSHGTGTEEGFAQKG